MRELVYDKNELKSFKNFYEKIYLDLEAKKNENWADYENLHYNADLLNEFLWNCQDDNLLFIMKNFDLDKIKEQKSYENYEWNLIFKVLNRFVIKYPNNKMIIINDTDIKG